MQRIDRTLVTFPEPVSAAANEPISQRVEKSLPLLARPIKVVSIHRCSNCIDQLGEFTEQVSVKNVFLIGSERAGGSCCPAYSVKK